MKKHLSLFVILLTVLSNLNANGAITYTTTQVKSVDDIVDGGYYFILYKNSSKYNCFCFSGNYTRGYNSYYNDSKSQVSFSTAISGSNIIKFIKKADNDWQLYDIKLNKYLGISDVNKYNYLSLYDEPQTENKIFFEEDTKVNDLMYIRMTTENGSNFRLALNGAEYEWYSLSNKDVKELTLFRITNYITSLDESKDIPTTTGETNISLNVTFVNDQYNTLMLPCAISGSYKAVFGTDVTVYSVTSIGTDGITFSPVTDGNGLSANTPYLLKGTFFTPPYIINNTTISTTGANDGIMSVVNGSNTFNGVYATGKDLGKSEAYILYMGKFYSCSSYSSMPIKLFRWYYKGATQQAKQLIISNTPTGINVPESIAQEHSDSRIFRLDGTYAGTSFDVLPKGFYINNGKKIVKQ